MAVGGGTGVEPEMFDVLVVTALTTQCSEQHMV